MGNLLSLSVVVLMVQVSTAADVEVQIRAHLPNHLNSISSLYVSGSDKNLGNWEPNAVRLTRMTRYTWQTKLRLPESQDVEFKFTLGDWSHVETTNLNLERTNRKLNCKKMCEVDVEIENFRLTPFHPKPQTASGRIEYHHEIYFQELDNLRSLAVYLPPGYRDSQQSYPVLYAMDGQNLFDNATATFGEEWRLDETADALITSGEIPPIIIVGIYSTDKRSEELLMNPNYANFVAYSIKPFIENRYRVKSGRENAGILGSSFGGVFGFYMAWKYSNLFEKFAVPSTAFWWGDFAIEKMISRFSPVGRPLKLWMDMGTQEGGRFKNAVEEMKRSYSIIKDDFPGVLQMSVIEGGTHNERAWAARAGEILKFLYKR